MATHPTHSNDNKHEHEEGTELPAHAVLHVAIPEKMQLRLQDNNITHRHLHHVRVAQGKEEFELLLSDRGIIGVADARHVPPVQRFQRLRSLLCPPSHANGLRRALLHDGPCLRQDLAPLFSLDGAALLKFLRDSRTRWLGLEAPAAGASWFASWWPRLRERCTMM